MFGKWVEFGQYSDPIAEALVAMNIFVANEVCSDLALDHLLQMVANGKITIEDFMRLQDSEDE